MDLATYASVVEENYQRLADILLSSGPDASKVQRLLSIDLLTAPTMKHGYAISPLVLLSQAPGKPVFTERELSAAITPGLIADTSSSRRYAVELGLFERQGDVYRLSGMGTAAHWVEGYLRAGVDRYAGQKPDAVSADVATGG